MTGSRALNRQLDYIAFIPARGGSKGIPSKNLQLVGGIPLVQRTILTVRRAQKNLGSAIRVVVSTDSPQIAQCALEVPGTEIHYRPAELAKDSSVLEEALYHFFQEPDGGFDKCEDAVVAVLQCTSPFTRPDEVTAGLAKIYSHEFDSAFIGFENHYWLYTQEADHSWRPFGHEVGSRPPRQKLKPQAHEIGAGYFFLRSGFMDAGFRLHGRIGLVEASLLTALDIDDPKDLAFCQRIADTLTEDLDY